MSNHYIDDPTVIDVEVEDGGSVAGTRFTPGSTLILDDYDVLHVNVTDRVEKGNPLPVSGEAVRTSIDEALDPWIQKLEGEKDAFLAEAGNKLQQVTVQTNTTLAEAKAELDADKNAFLEDAGDALEEIREVVQDNECAPHIVCEASGETILVQDSAERLLHGLTLYGKTTQNGTPTPEAPVELVSVGDDGSVGVTVAGKNLCADTAFDSMKASGGYTSYDASTHTITATEDKNGLRGYYCYPFQKMTIGKPYTISFYVRGTSGLNVRCGWDSKYTKITLTDTFVRYSVSFIASKAQEPVIFYLDGSATGGFVTGNYLQFDRVQIEAGTTATAYEPYKPFQTLSASTPNGLPGYPVSSGGNYTDETGQEWICDEVDFARGVYVKQMRERVLDGTENFKKSTSGFFYINIIGTEGALNREDALTKSTHFVGVRTSWNNLPNNSIMVRGNQIGARCDTFATADDFNAFLAEQYANGTPVTLQYILATPIETDLSAEELAQYTALRSYKPNTTVFNDAGAGMAAAYVADTKNYIDNKLAAISAAMLHA